VHPINTTGIIDNAGERDPWLELYNDSTVDLPLVNWALSDSPAALLKFNFPGNAVVPARGYLLVWADGSVTSPAGEIHANFRLSSTGGTVYLSTLVAGVPLIADHVRYTAQANQSFGSPVDGLTVGRQLLLQSSPGGANSTPILGPTLQVERAQGGGLRLNWIGLQGLLYTVEARTDIASGTWQNVMQAAGNGGTLTHTISPPFPSAYRFYRVRAN
jgi:hypothetical protein